MPTHENKGPRNYTFSLSWSVEDEGYIATVNEVPGVSAFGAAAADALEEVQEALEVTLAVYREEGRHVPDPKWLTSYSGQFRLRLPKALHAQLAGQATAEGVSLNTLAVQYLSAALASHELSEHACQRIDTAVVRFEQTTAAMASGNWKVLSDISRALGGMQQSLKTRVEFLPKGWEESPRVEIAAGREMAS